MKTKYLFGIVALLYLGCTETEFDKVTLPTTDIAGEYVVTLELPAFGISEEHNIRVFNTAYSTDSLWVEDHDFFETQVRVKRDGANKFSVTQGTDLFSGIEVNINGEIFPEKDSIHVEWEYLQVDFGDGPEDYVVTGNGVLYNGLTN
jgi:hypothetical protein